MRSMHATEKDEAARAIRALAEHHEIAHAETVSDVLGRHIARLAGDEVELDEPALLLLALQRAGHVTREEAARLHGDYLRAKYE